MSKTPGNSRTADAGMTSHNDRFLRAARAISAAGHNWFPGASELHLLRKLAKTMTAKDLGIAMGWDVGEGAVRYRCKKFHIPILGDTRTKSGLKVRASAEYHYDKRVDVNGTDQRPFRTKSLS